MKMKYNRQKGSLDYSTDINESQLTLLGENSGVEVILQTIKANDFVMLTPAHDDGLCEYFFIVDGSVALECDNEKVELGKGDFFSAQSLATTIMLKCEVQVTLLYISSKPVFHHVKVFVSNLDEMINRVDEKDKYTKMHCQHVMDFSIAISRKMGCSAEMTERLAISALFHDVGKCKIPDDVLQKPGRLTLEERKFIYKHPLASKQLVESNFGDEIANIVMCHHEREDGSGYPQGLPGVDIPLEAKIIAVADSFDAMTTKRPYNTPKSYLEAAEELVSMREQYCQEAAKALLELVINGEIEIALKNPVY